MRAITSSDESDVPSMRAATGARLIRLALLSVAAGGVTFGVLALVSPRYEAEARIAIVPAVPLAELSSEAVNAHVRALLSPELAAAIADELDLAGRPEFSGGGSGPGMMSALLRLAGLGGARAGESDQGRVLNAYFRRLEVYLPEESRTIGVRFSSGEPELSAAVANRIAETYRETLAMPRVSGTDDVAGARGPENAKLADEAAPSKAEAERVRGARTANGGFGDAGLSRLEEAVKSKRAELARLEAQYEIDKLRAEGRAVAADAHIVARAKPPRAPAFPQKAPFAAFVTVAAFLFGVTVIVSRDLIFGARRRNLRPEKAGREARVLPSVALPVQESTPEAYPELTVPPRVFEIGSIAEAARHLRGLKAPSSSGYRTLITGEVERITVWDEATELATGLAESGAAVILVDWSPEGRGISRMLGQACEPGMSELLEGAARFEDVVGCLPESVVHFIAAGAGCDGELFDADRINMVLDALDEVYDHIIVAGRREAARRLFEVIQGRFDAGITVAEPRQRIGVVCDPLETFLDYEVDGIELLYFERAAAERVTSSEPPRLRVVSARS